VLSDRPRHVVKEVADERVQVRRETTPAVHVNDNRVDVRFDLTIRARHGSEQQAVQELHPMRYLFLPELDLLFSRTGFVRESAHAWLAEEAPSDSRWYACVVARAS
jgi:hypothetical protein